MIIRRGSTRACAWTACQQGVHSSNFLTNELKVHAVNRMTSRPGQGLSARRLLLVLQRLSWRCFRSLVSTVLILNIIACRSSLTDVPFLISMRPELAQSELAPLTRCGYAGSASAGIDLSTSLGVGFSMVCQCLFLAIMLVSRSCIHCSSSSAPLAARSVPRSFFRQ